MECNIYHAAFLDLSEQQFTLLSDDAKVKYMMILNEVFEDRKIDWGRIILVRKELLHLINIKFYSS